VETTVYVAPDQYRKGIGSSLYQVLLPELRARGFHTALGGISLPNEASVRPARAMRIPAGGTAAPGGLEMRALGGRGLLGAGALRRKR